MCYVDDLMFIVCYGKWEGKIFIVLYGSNGFGYDFIFWVLEENCVFVELELVCKKQLFYCGKVL